MLGALGIGLATALLGSRFLFDEPADAVAAGCRGGDVLAGVHHPSRLKVIAPCVTAHGTVVDLRVAGDGDWHIGLLPDPADLDLLARGNVARAAGLLVVEVVPADQAGLQPPRPGSRIAVTGAYVLDTHRSWREIHPAWRLAETAPSPLPPGTGTVVRQTAATVRRILIRLRAFEQEVVASLTHRKPAGADELD